MRTHAWSAMTSVGLAIAVAVTVPWGAVGSGPVAAAERTVCSVSPQKPTVRARTLTAGARASCPSKDTFSMLVVELERRAGRSWRHVGSDFQISRPDTPLRARTRVPCRNRGKVRYRTRAFTYALAEGKSRTRTRIAQATLRC